MTSLKKQFWRTVPLAALILGSTLARATGEETPRLRVVPGEIDVGLSMFPERAISLSPDECRWVGFATSEGDGCIDLTTGKVTALKLHESAGQYFHLVSYDNAPVAWWSPDGGSVAWTVWRQGKSAVAVWRAGSGLGGPESRELLPLPRSLYFTTSLVWSPDGKTLYLVISQELRRQKSQPKDDYPPTKSANVELSLSGGYFDEEEYLGRYDKLYPEAYAERYRSLILAIDVATGKFGVLARGNDIFSNLCLSPDGRHLAALQTKGGMHKKDPRADFEQKLVDVYLIDTARVDSLPAIDLEKMDDHTAGWLDFHGQRLMPTLTDVCMDGFSENFDEVGDIPFKLGTGTSGNPQVVWDSDSSCFAYATVGRQASGDVFVYDLGTRQARNLTEGVSLEITAKQQGYYENQRSEYSSLKFGSIFNPLWLADGKSLIVRGRGDAWLIALDPKAQPRNLTAAFDQEIKRILPAPGLTRAAQDAQGRVIVVTRDRLSRYDTVWKLDPVTGSLTKVADTGVSTSLLLATDVRSEYLVYTGQSVTSSTNLYRVKLDATADKGNKPDDVTKYQLQLNDRIFPESRVLSWKTREGYPGYGILYLPAGASPDKKVPLVFEGYPSQTVSRTDRRAFLGALFYNPALDGLLNDGIAYLYADLPMSDQGVNEHPMMQIVNDVNTAVDAAVATGCIDEKRMAIEGTSYGGFMVDAVLTQSNRFKTGVSISGMCDLTAFFLGNAGPQWEGNIEQWTGWAEYRQGRIGRKLWEDPEQYVENSPISQWDKVRTPMLFIHGGYDSIVKSTFGEEGYKGLKIQRKDAIYAYYPRLAHGADMEANQRIRGWLREYLLGKPPITQIADQGSFFLGGSDAPAAPSGPSSPPTLGN